MRYLDRPKATWTNNVEAPCADLVRSASGHHVHDGDVGVRMAVSQSRQRRWQQVQGSRLERPDPQTEREVAEQCGQFRLGPGHLMGER